MSNHKYQHAWLMWPDKVPWWRRVLERLHILKPKDWWSTSESHESLFPDEDAS